MNITPHTPSLPIATVVNPPTEGLRRDNNQREIITQVSATNPSAADKSVASEKERARTPAQSNEQVDFAQLRKQAEQAASSISEQENHQGEQQNAKQNQEESANANNNTSERGASEIDESENKNADEHAKKAALTDERIITELQQRDKEVRTHELAHASAGGGSTGSPSYTFEVGPDGKKYAVGGEVSVDLSGVPGDPKATINKMQKVHAAALAPASPSTQDIKVAASATQRILSAQSELLSLNSNEGNQSDSENSDIGVNNNSTFNVDNDNNSSNEFDTFINQTLSAQEDISSSSNQTISPQNNNNSQSNEVIQRAHRIESFYFTVSQGYEKPDNFQFELTA